MRGLIDISFLDSWDSPLVTVWQLVQFGIGFDTIPDDKDETKELMRDLYGGNFIIKQNDHRKMGVGFIIFEHILSNDIDLIRGDIKDIKEFTYSYEIFMEKTINWSEKHGYFDEIWRDFVGIAKYTAILTKEARDLLRLRTEGNPQQAGGRDADHARQWRELAETLQGKERKAALCAACKWEGMTHIEAYDTLFPGNVVEKKSKNTYVSKMLRIAKTLSETHGLKLPRDGGE